MLTPFFNAICQSRQLLPSISPPTVAYCVGFLNSGTICDWICEGDSEFDDIYADKILANDVGDKGVLVIPVPPASNANITSTVSSIVGKPTVT